MQHRTLGRTGRSVSVVGLGTWQLGADWGDVSEADARAVLEAAVGGGRHVLRHRRRLRRRPQRDADRPVPRRPTRRRHHRRHQDGPPRRAGARELRAGQLPRLDRPLAPQPRRGHPRPGAAALPADVGLLRRRGLRRARHPGRGGRGRRLRGQRGEGRGGARRDRPARTSRPCRSSPTPSGSSRSRRCSRPPPRPASGSSSGCRWPPACSRGKYDAEHHVRRRRPPHLQPRRQRLRRRARPSPGVDYATGVAAAREFAALVAARGAGGTTPAQAAIAWLWQHAAVSTVIPGARNVEQARGNAAAGRLAPLGRGFDRGVRRIYDEHLRAASTPAGDLLRSPRDL